EYFNIKNIDDVYRLVYIKMDHLLLRGIHETSSVRWSGTSTFTAVVVVNDKIEDFFHFFKENVEALGIQAGEVVLMSQKHTSINKRERERILETGNNIFS
ncbi:unnamed protein product, partial [Rotaria sp. Silwood1]